MRSAPVRPEISAAADAVFVEMLVDAHDLEPRDVYRVSGPVDPTALMALHRLDGVAGLKDEPLVPRVAPLFAPGGDLFDAIRDQDLLRHMPYASFGCVVDFIAPPADDPTVLTSNTTLY